MGRVKASLIKEDEVRMLNEYEQWEAELEHAFDLEDFDYYQLKKGCQFPPPRATNLTGK